ncbi:EEF1A lysine methyltransferase 3 isoform X2 [Rosa chinensis]|uniref:EEF1A lysine methyltransferase 3 isoform X2 n=1 Tax=Rosa chinensis TaxID=74649 RepID=UPI000D095E9C|nr:EEF1A lysine methyltransferase 3 isoform X2 [Rosa chinensis]
MASEVVEEEKERLVIMGSYGGMVRQLRAPKGEEDEDEEEEEDSCGATAAEEEIMLLWGIQQPTLSKPNAFVAQSSLQLKLDSCGQSLSIFQSPSSLSTPGVTGAVMWDSGVVLGKFLEHAVDSELLLLQGKKVVELGSGCGLVGCIAALLGSQAVLTDLPDRLRLLKKNIDANLRHGDVRGSAKVMELQWGDDPDLELIEPPPDFVLGSDVIYSEGAVLDLLSTLRQLCGSETTVFLAGELRNECAMEDFIIGRLEQSQWHPDFCSSRVVLYVLVKK